MKPSELYPVVAGLPYMTLRQAQTLYDLITTERLSKGLELGFYHGVSSVYIAGALQDVSESGHLTTIDLLTSIDRQPNIMQLLEAAGLTDKASVYFEKHSYIWRLMKMLEHGLYGSVDFCYIDGGHTWGDTGFAVSLVALLLRQGGWIVLDDLDWTLAKSRALSGRPLVRTLPEELRHTPGVRKAFELLIRKDPRFCDAFEQDGWGFARRT